MKKSSLRCLLQAFFCVTIFITSGCVVSKLGDSVPVVSLTPAGESSESISAQEFVKLDPVIEAKFDSLLSQMNLEEKIGQMTQVEIGSIKPGDIKNYFIGSILSGGGGSPEENSVDGWRKMIGGFQQEALATPHKIPLLYGMDAIHGHTLLYGATIFPHQIGLGATRNLELVYKIGRATADEMLATGVTWTFGPVVAVPQDIRWGRTYESYSEDTALVSELTRAYIEGLQDLPEGYRPVEQQSHYTLATAKHYLGDGGTVFGSSTQEIIEPYHLDQGDMILDEAVIRALFLPPYQAAVESGAMSVMVSFSSWNGIKMHEQKYWLTDVLKTGLGFTGFVVSDWGGIDQVDEDYYSAVVRSINAGIDMNMVPYDYIRFINTMKEAIEKGDISLERVDDAVRRILRTKMMLGLFDRPVTEKSMAETVGSKEHRELARQAVRESLVLLKNENSALPIPKDASSIYVAGVGADDIGIQCGGWTVEWQGLVGDILPGTTILEGIKEAVAATTSISYEMHGKFEGMADIGIAVVGEMPYAEGVGDADTLKFSLTDIQTIQNLREHSRKLIVIILSGRPLVITDQYQIADAWVAAWLPGTEGAGVADVLFGDHPFTGKLPYTWPRSDGQLPVNINNAISKGCEAPLFPFGYGLDGGGSEPISWMDCPSGE